MFGIRRAVLLTCLGVCLWAASGGHAWADEFERLEGPVLASIPKSADAVARSELSVAALDALPGVLSDARSALLVATTDQGNPVRLLVSPALRKVPASDRPPIPVLVVERFDTFEAGNLGKRLARGKDLILFDGFQVDLDSGQVVPEGQGADLKFQATGEGGPRLAVVGKAMLYTLTRAPTLVAPPAGRPSIGRTVLPGDFTGRYRLFANGQWSGWLELAVGADGAVSGRFLSDLNGAVYPVTGQVAPEIPNRIAFRLKLPRTQQDFEGYLWTEGKGAMAGTLTMLERVYGFFALREGGRFAPEGEDVGPLAGAPEKAAASAGRRTVTLSHGQYTLDGQPRTDQELTDALRRAFAVDPATWVLLKVADDEPYGAVQRAFTVVSASGVQTIRLGSAD